MGEVARRLREASRLGDHDTMARLVGTRTMDVWFAITPDELSGMLAEIPAEKLNVHPEAALITRLLSFARGGGSTDHLSAARETIPAHLRRWLLLIEGAQARLKGDAVTAYDVFAVLPEVTGPVPAMIDPSTGIRSLFLDQAATSAALAGRFGEALALYEKALRVPPTSGQQFFHRAAHLRAALIHGLFGDIAAAHAHRHRASRIPRTESWVEELLDPDEALVDTVLAGLDGARDAMFDRALQLTYGPMGEFWPFYLLAMRRIGVPTEHRIEARARTEALLASGLGTTGSGLLRSVPGLLLAFDSLLSGNVAQAKQEWKAVADQTWPTTIVGALIAMASGAPKTAIGELTAARSLTEGLRQAEHHRSRILQLAHHLSGDPAATKHLHVARRRLGPQEIAVMRVIAPGLLTRLAKLTPDLLPPGYAFADGRLVDVPSLTQGELQVLQGLGRGESRRQIAENLFRSVNTIKTHQRSLYRKLEVTSAMDAVLRATDAGYL